MSCLFLDILHLSVGQTLLPPYTFALIPCGLSVASDGGQHWDLTERWKLSVNVGFVTYHSSPPLACGFTFHSFIYPWSTVAWKY